ncbi:MAG: molecular chaperone DnaJ [Deltaproteobacteria bacterium]|nr:molecular chaperone DnaJ [Deltaproteobacteria bacterium]
MENKDLYKLLGVSPDVTDAELKKAYRAMAHKYHPDKNQDDKDAEEKFKEINEAYEILKDPEKRTRYDRFGYAGVSGAAGAGAGPGGAHYNADFQDFFGDMFSEFFGGGRARRGPTRGDDLRYDMTITFEEAAFGAKKDVEHTRITGCESCKGSGAKPGTSPERCSVCSGSGQQRFQQGFFTFSRPCSQCKGQGSVIKSPCAECSGRGSNHIKSKITVNIPAGIDTGSRLRVAGEGNFGDKGGPPGDLYIFMTVTPHPLFKRDGDDVYCEVPITLAQAALGTEIEAPTIEGPVKVKIPAGTQTGKVFRLKNKGIASLRNGRRGDHFVAVRLETPAKLNKRQRELLEEFAAISGDEVFPEKKNFFDKVKEIFG